MDAVEGSEAGPSAAELEHDAQAAIDRARLRAVFRKPAASTRLRRIYDDPTLRLLLAGGLAGCISKTVTAPLARLTILYQVQSTNMVPGWSAGRAPGIGEALARVVRTEGVAALWKGNGVTVVHRLPYSALNFFAYEKLMAALSHGRPAADRQRDAVSAHAVGARLAAGAGAGAFACAATYPLDLVRTRLAAQTTGEVRYTGLVQALRSIAARDGARGLYRGLGPTLCGVAPSLALNFAVYETLRGAAQSAHPAAHPAWTALFAGSAAGAVSSVACFPLDLVRRRLQLAGGGGGAAAQVPTAAATSARAVAGGRAAGAAGAAGAGSMLAAARAVARSDGLAGFYRGLGPELLKVVPGVGIAFAVYELLKKRLGV